MMRFVFVCVIICLLFSCTEEKVAIDGNWQWVFTNDHDQTHQVRVQLNHQDADEVLGFYCSSYALGEFLDCADSDSNQKNVPNIVLNRISPIKFSGTFRSNRSGDDDKVGKINVTYFKSNDNLYFNLEEEPDGSFYFPDGVEFKRMESEK